MGLCPTMAPSTPFVQRPSFACRINQLPARENWPCLYLRPPVEQFEYLDFSVADKAVEIGYRYGVTEIGAWRKAAVPEDPPSC